MMERKRLACACCCCIAVCAAAGGAGGAPAGRRIEFPAEGVIAADGTNLRAGRSLNYESVAQLEKGSPVTVTGFSRGWFRVDPPEDVPFWVSTRYLSDGRVSCGRLNVRAKPLPNATVLCQLERGDEVEETGKQGEWTSIAPPDCADLWVSAELIELTPEEKGEETPDESALEEQPAASAAAALRPAETPAPAPTPAPPPPAAVPGGAGAAAPPPAGVPCRQRGKLVRSEEMGASGAPFCLVQGFFRPAVVCLLDSRTVNLSHYLGDRVRIWGYEASRLPEGIPMIDVRRLEVE